MDTACPIKATNDASHGHGHLCCIVRDAPEMLSAEDCKEAISHTKCTAGFIEYPNTLTPNISMSLAVPEKRYTPRMCHRTCR